MKILLCPNGYTGEQAEQAATCLSVLEKSGHLCALLEANSVLENSIIRSLSAIRTECCIYAQKAVFSVM